MGEPRLWDPRQDEHFYGQRRAQGSGSVSTGTGSGGGGGGGGGGGRWRYPANFDDTEPVSPIAGMEIGQDGGKKKKNRGLLGVGSKKKKDRWALSEDARRGARVPDGEYVGVPEDTKKKKKKGKKKGEDLDGDSYVRQVCSPTPDLPLLFSLTHLVLASREYQPLRDGRA